MTTHCPSAEELALFAEGKLKSADALLLHVEGCRECRAALTLLNQTIAGDRPPARVVWWGGLAAAAALAAVAILVWQRLPSRSPIAALAEMAPRSARIVEPRLSGGFAWAPYHGPMRGDRAAADAAWLKLAGAAGNVIERASRDSSAEAQHAAGVAYVLIEQPSEAIDRLRAAANRSPGRVDSWSDLAAAQYTAALRLPNPALYAEALASADRALRIDPANPEALFNRALILEHMGLAGPARTAWQRYLEVDPSSKWAVEARTRLGALPQASGDSLFKRALPHVADGTMATIVRTWPEQSRAWGEAEFLGQWGEAVQRGDAPEAQRLLAIARALGDALRAQTGEALLGDAVTAIDRAASDRAADTHTLAEAHAIYRRGRMTYGRQRPSAAEPDLRRAALLFARAGSPMARMARYYAANTRFDQNDIPAARAELEALIGDEQYAAAGALERWQLALCHFADGDGEAAVAPLSAAAQTLDRIGERNNHGFVESLLADAFASTGNPSESWAARIRSFDALSRAGRGERLLADVASAVTAERRAGHRENALALLEVEREVGRENDDPVLLANTLARGAVLSAELDDLLGASKLVDEAASVASTIRDPAFRAIDDANVALARGAATLQDDPHAAEKSLGDALAAYQGMGQRALEVDCHLLLAHVAERLGDRETAAREVDAGLDLFDRFAVTLDGRAVDPGVLDSGNALFADAIRLSLDRGDVARAFGYAERSRRRTASLPPPAEIAGAVQSRLAGSGAAVLELVVLPRETVAFAVDERGVDAVRKRIPRDALLELARRCADGDADAAAALHDLLIPPLHDARSLIVVSDPLLDDVPFAALRDRRSGRRLIEQVPIAMAESAMSLRPAAASPPTRAVTVSLTPALAESESEADDVAASYANGVRLTQSTFASFVAAAQDAEVLHISGHTENDDDRGKASLVFVRERVSWRSIAGQSFPRLRVAVLAACDTLRAPRFAGTRAPSLGGAFLSAGARDVIGTLRPIGDRDARELFRAIHRQLAAGAGAAEAVRRVQLEALARDQSAWSSIAILTRTIPAVTQGRHS